MKLFLIPLLTVLMLATPALVAPMEAQPPTRSPQQVAAEVVTIIRAENLTAEQAWDRGLLTKYILLRVLDDENLLDSPRSQWRRAPEGTAFTELLLKECLEVLEPPLELGTNVKIRLMQYFEAKKDPRIGTFLEDALDSLVGTDVRLSTVSSMLSKLSQHYRDTGEVQKALDTPYRIHEFTQWPRAIAEVFLHAARVSYSKGEEEQAKRFHEELHKCKDGWASGAAYGSAARHLSSKGKREEARAVLKTPFQGVQEDAFRIFTYTALATSYVETKEWGEARRYAEAAMEELNKISEADRSKRELNGFPKTIQSILDRIDQQRQATVPLQQ